MSIKYRPEVDGLRTIAVGSVLINHFEMLGNRILLPGGFLGVDIFFVISGYLITSLIHREWSQSGTFSIIGFYERRARRILPALFGVIFASWLFAWYLLLPNAMMDFVKSQLASLGFVSNMYWWGVSETYGTRSSLLEPFLHTWSLAVEEQYYIFFPLAYVALLKVCRTHTVLLTGLAVIAVGLVGAEIASTVSWDLSFYWLPSRIWELLSGATLAQLLATRPDFGRTPLALKVLPKLGLALLLLPMPLMELDWHHPGFGTVPVVLGVVLIIWFASPGEAVTRLLSSRLFVGIGLISYSLYLWHYPVIAFGKMMVHYPSPALRAGWVVLTFVLAYASYLFVERPFRSPARMSRGRLVLVLGSFTAATVAFALAMLATNGLPSRFNGLKALYGKNNYDNEILRDQSWEPMAALAAAQGLGPGGARGPSDFEAHRLWFDASGREKILVIGDSHSKDLFNAFLLNRDRFSDAQFARFGMLPALLPDQVAALRAAPNFKAADRIVLSFRYPQADVARFGPFVRMLRQSGKRVDIVLRALEFSRVDGVHVFDWYVMDSGKPFSAAGINALAWQQRKADAIAPVNEALRAIGRETGSTVLDRADFMCDAQAQTCDLVTDDGYKVLYDAGHWTVEGARYFGRRIAATGWLLPRSPSSSAPPTAAP